MHISDGVLSIPVIAAGWTASVAFIGYSKKKIDDKDIPLVSVVAAAVFTASLIRIPIGPSSVHLTMLSVAGILLGWRAPIAIFAALILQFFLFQFGGFISLGINTTIMSATAISSCLIFKKIKIKNLFLRSYLACLIPVVLCGALVVVALTLSNPKLFSTAKLVFISHIVLGVIEAFITAIIIQALVKNKMLNKTILEL